MTDETGLAIFDDVPTGELTLVLDEGEATVTVVEEREIYDVVLAVKPGSVEIRAQGALLFGAWDPFDGAQSIIDGDINMQGGSTRMRGLVVNGTLTTSANGFACGFSTLAGANVTANEVTLLRNHFEGNASVPSTNAVLVDNTGIP